MMLKISNLWTNYTLRACVLQAVTCERAKLNAVFKTVREIPIPWSTGWTASTLISVLLVLDVVEMKTQAPIASPGCCCKSMPACCANSKRLPVRNTPQAIFPTISSSEIRSYLSSTVKSKNRLSAVNKNPEQSMSKSSGPHIVGIPFIYASSTSAFSRCTCSTVPEPFIHWSVFV